MNDTVKDDFCLRIPAIRSQQAERPFYMASVPFRMLSRLVDFDTGNVLDRSQRKTDPGRANAIARYIKCNEKSYVLPPLVGNLSADGIRFEEVVKGTNCGSLIIPMDAQIKLLDGQHRTTAILAAMKDMPWLSQHCIAIHLFRDMSLKERQQAFSDINSNAKPVSRSINLAYNHRENSLQIMAEEISLVRAWEGKIDMDRNAANHKLGCLFSYKHAIAASTLLLGYKKGASLDEVTAMKVSSWFNSISAAVGWDDAEIDPNKVSNTAVGLMALARLGALINELRKTEGGIDELSFYQRLFDVDWCKSADIWQGVLVEDGKMITGKAAEEAAVKVLAAVTRLPDGAVA